MEKYYTPSIEEFYVGFEYEYKSLQDSKWKKGICETGTESREDFTFRDTEKHLDRRRVKHLDTEDIESLGLEYDNNAEPIPARDYPHMFIPTAYAKEDWMLYHYEYDSVIWIENYKEDSFYFKGVIKNKSELKKVLKMLGI